MFILRYAAGVLRVAEPGISIFSFSLRKEEMTHIQHRQHTNHEEGHHTAQKD
jgi:hypothetical protein